MTVEVLGTVLRRLGGFDPVRFQQDFDARLRLQKTVHILEEGFGVDLGYPFSYYLRGPYSTALARDTYQLSADRFNSLPLRKFKDSATEQSYERFANFIGPHLNDARWLESASTLLWNLNRGTTTMAGLRRFMAAKGQPIDADYCRSVIAEMEKAGLVPPEAAAALLASDCD